VRLGQSTPKRSNGFASGVEASVHVVQHVEVGVVVYLIVERRWQVAPGVTGVGIEDVDCLG
jgi:hypothetical protein